MTALRDLEALRLRQLDRERRQADRDWWADQPTHVVTCWVHRDGEWTLRVRPLSRAELAKVGP